MTDRHHLDSVDMNNQNCLNVQMKQYAMCSDNLNEIQNQLNNMEGNGENYDIQGV